MSSIPAWFPRIRLAPGALDPVRRLLADERLHTVCEGALCPNRPECYGARHLTVLILGDACTRRCGFCAVGSAAVLPPDPGEPERVARAVARLGMRHVVVTSVTRDDLPDGGASHYAAVAEALARSPEPPSAEALLPDFQGREEPLARVARAPYRVLGHNVETVPRLYPAVRPQADYRRSLGVLAALHRLAPGAVTKSGLMLGLGETDAEVEETLRDLASAGVEVLTLGQYLQPTPREVSVARYLAPEEFERWADRARTAGIACVVAGAHVRSSYRAGEALRLLEGGAISRQTAPSPTTHVRSVP